MALALELRGISKTFLVGTINCRGAVHALRRVDLDVRCGEAVAIVGGPGAGKSTLLLCAAGLLRVDTGAVSWFGRDDRSIASERTRYYFPGATGPTNRDENAARIHLVDGPESLCLATSTRIERWIHRRCCAGDAVVFATRMPEVARALAHRTLVLRDGRMHAEEALAGPARVAEPIEWGRR
jgi:ABC-type glutathione transport system ATPase component